MIFFSLKRNNLFMTKLHGKVQDKQTAHTLGQALPYLPRDTEAAANSALQTGLSEFKGSRPCVQGKGPGGRC